MKIYRELETLTTSYDNFAYFCRFDRETRRIGREQLFMSGSGPVLINYEPGSDAKKAAGDIESIAAHSGVPQIPVFIGFDFVNFIYPDLGVRESGWPAFACLIPDTTLESEVIRNGNPGNYRKDEPERDIAMEKTIMELRERIRSGEILQVVVSREYPVDIPDKFDLLREFIENDTSLYVFYYRFGKYEIIGSSPENMVSVEGNSLIINPIAGTRPRGVNEAQDQMLAEELSADPKEQMEHRMLVDLARNDLGKISVPGTVRVTMDMRIQKFSTVQHLVSTVTSTKRPGVGFMEIIMAAFPAGTVSGAPKKRAIRIIDQYEESPRGAYSGCIGLIGEGSMDLALLIRSVYGISGKYSVRAGAGIVKDSDPERECKEMFSKAMTVIGGIKNESSGN
ncbi:Anthranilate synthase component 1 [Thermoplasmatales archaeon]|nr:Anthranilate synthase component 1 [Thermoplasmatales archaeon]